MEETYISKKNAREIILNQPSRYDMLENIKSAPSADVRPNIHGHWEDKDGISDFMYCSNCGGKKHYSEKWIGCPYCLADMREPTGEKGGHNGCRKTNK